MYNPGHFEEMTQVRGQSRRYDQRGKCVCDLIQPGINQIIVLRPPLSQILYPPLESKDRRMPHLPQLTNSGQVCQLSSSLVGGAL